MDNVVFIRPSKVAGTSISLALDLEKYRSTAAIKRRFRQTGWVDFGHMEYRHLRKAGYIGDEFDKKAFKFAFVRNPYDRAVSMYTDAAARGGRDPIHRAKVRALGFLGFCKEILGNGIKPVGLHHYWLNSIYSPQVRWLENVELDFVGRFEKLREHFKMLTHCLNMTDPVPLPLERRSREGFDIEKRRWTRGRHHKEPWTAFYCNETRAIVERVYGEDFERLNYPILDGQ